MAGSDAADVLAAALTELLTPLQLGVVDDLRTLGEIEPKQRGVVQVNLSRIQPTTMQGQWQCTWDAWLCVPQLDPAESEAELMALLPDVIAALESVRWLIWDDATRETHPDNFAAWRMTLTTLT